MVILCFLCILASLATSSVLTSHFSTLIITRRNLLTRQDQLFVSSCAACVFTQVSGVRCQVSGVRCQVSGVLTEV